MAFLWRQFFKRRHLFPNGMAANAYDFISVMNAEDTVIYELGDFEGVVFCTGILPRSEAGLAEPRANVHIMTWSEAMLGKTALFRELCLRAIKEFDVDRLMSEIPAFNKTAIAFGERVGFRRVGTLRHRYKILGRWEDSVVLDALPGDLK